MRRAGTVTAGFTARSPTTQTRQERVAGFAGLPLSTLTLRTAGDGALRAGESALAIGSSIGAFPVPPASRYRRMEPVRRRVLLLRITMSVPDARIRTTSRKEIGMGTRGIGPFGNDTATAAAALVAAHARDANLSSPSRQPGNACARASLPTFGRSLAEPSHAFAQCLSRRLLPSSSSTSSHKEASLARKPNLNPRTDRICSRLRVALNRPRPSFPTAHASQPAVVKTAGSDTCTPKIQYRQTDTAQQVYTDGCPEQRGRPGSPSDPEAMLSPSLSIEDLPPGSRVCDLVRGGDPKQHTQQPAPLAPAPTQACWWDRGRAASIGSGGSSDCPQPYEQGEIS